MSATGICDTELLPYESKEALPHLRTARSIAGSMHFVSQLRRCIAALLGLAVALVGLALVLQLAALLLWQYGVALQKPSWPKLPIGLLFADHAKLATTALAPYLQYVPQLEWSWLANRADTSATHAVAVWLVDKVHIGLVPALLGVPLLLGGGKLLLRQVHAVAAARRYRVDRMRRLAQYRKGVLEERLEPFDSYSGARSEYRDERPESRKEPFLGAQVEEPVNDPDIALPKVSALKAHKYY
jgi:hypothetical protein